MALVKGNARSSSALDATILTGNLPAISGASLTGVSATGSTGEENVWGLIVPDQVANWIERVA